MKRKFFLLALCTSLTLLAAEEESAPSLANEEELVAAVEEKSMAEVFEEEELIAAADKAGPSAAGFLSAGPEHDDFIDPRVLRDFVESRGLIKCRQKEGSLMIYGDVRARWIATGEKFNDLRMRGQGTKIAINRFKSEFNLYLDYTTPRTWTTTKVKFSSYGGREVGALTRVDLERAFIGYDICEQGDTDFYIEVGRSTLDYMFESRVEFGSSFDGIHIFYTRKWPTVGQFTIHGGPFVVDSFTNHYAWVLEAFVTKWCGTGLSLKYSIIDWHRFAPTLNYGSGFKDEDKEIEISPGTLTYRDNPRYRFLVSQMLFGYERKIDFLRCKTLFLYGAVLVNHDAKRVAQTNWKKLNGAWYVGFTLGKLCKACDWSVDLSYQYVQAQAVPEFDLAGIGHGNSAGGLLSDAILYNLAINKLSLFTNYKGWEASALYAMTDTLSLRAKAQYTHPCNKSIGGDFFFKSFEMSVIYAF